MALLLVPAGCRRAGEPATGLPPGPRDPAENLALLEAFADRVLRESLEASWHRTFGEPAEDAPFGRRPLRGLRSEELAALGRHLPEPEQQARLAAVERVALQLRHDSAPGVAESLAAVDAARAGLAPDRAALHRVLIESDDEAERRRAWLEAHAGAERLAPLVVELQRARRRWARGEGFADALEAFRSVDGVEPGTRERLRGQVAEALRVPEGSPLEPPWNLEAADPALARRLWGTLAAVPVELDVLATMAGVGAAAPRWRRSFETGGRATHATWAVDPPEDVRVVVELEDGLAGAWRLFHEAGHAAQVRRAPPRASPMLQRVRSQAVAEGAAKLFERLAFSPEWLATFGVSEADREAVADWEAVSERGRARRILADTEFEELLHDAPGGALDAMHRSAWAAHGLLSPAELPAWALERSLTRRPGERLDYLLARCAQAAIFRRLRALPGGLFGSEARALLSGEILPAAAGASYEDWFEAATGAPPSCEAWLEDVARLR